MTAPNTNQPTTDQETWQKAIEWVGSNMNLIRWVADPYLRYMAADSDDLFQVATIAAFQALTATRKKQMPQRFVPFFRVIFKTHCLKMASGIQSAHFLNEYFLYTSSREEMEPEPFQREIEEALQSVGGRRREVCAWILEQAQPVSTMETAQHFKVSQRQVRRLLHKTIEQLTKAA